MFFYESPTVRNLIDFYWQKSTKYLWGWLIFNFIPVSLFTAFALLRIDHERIVSELLAGTIGINSLLLLFEILQITSNFREYTQDAFNFIELVIILVQFVTAGLFWGDALVAIASFFVSLSLLLWYTKILVLLRIIDQLRQLIRMIIEIVTGSLSFMTVIFTYIVAFTILMYQSRKASGTDDLNFWEVALEMYTFGIGSYDDMLYSGVTMPFFIIATILMPLILLNMLIAFMGDIYGKAKDDAVAINAKERIAMISEISSTVIQLRKIFRWINRRTTQGSSQLYYILIAEPYETNEGSAIIETFIEHQSNKMQKYMQDQLELIDSRSKLREDKLQADLDVMKNQMNQFQADLDSLKNQTYQMSELLKKALMIDENA